MSVILFSKEEVYQELADSYEGLKGILRRRPEDDERFYKALRRLYFANVAAYLCQYHDDSPLGSDELAGIDPFQDLQGPADPFLSTAEKVARFITALDSLILQFPFRPAGGPACPVHAQPGIAGAHRCA